MEAVLTTQSSAKEAPGRFAEIVGNMPASYFGIVLGLAGLGSAWRAASRAWQLPPIIAEWIYIGASVVWALLVILYILSRSSHRRSWWRKQPIPFNAASSDQAGVATMLIAGGLVPHHRLSADIVFAVGFVFTLVFAVWRTGGLWQGERDHAATTAVLYLPTVAGSFVSAIVVSALGYPDWGQFAFGAGSFRGSRWNRCCCIDCRQVPQRRSRCAPHWESNSRQHRLVPSPTSPSAAAYRTSSSTRLSATASSQLLVMARLSHWIAQARCSPRIMGVQLRATAIATAPMQLIARGDHGAVAVLGPLLVHHSECGYRQPHRHDVVPAVIGKDVRLLPGSSYEEGRALQKTRVS